MTMLHISQLDKVKHLAYRHRRLTDMIAALYGDAGAEASIRIKTARPGVGMGHSTLELDFKPEELRPMLEAHKTSVECDLFALGVTV